MTAEAIVQTAAQLGGALSEQQLQALPALCRTALAAVERRCGTQPAQAADALLCGAAYLALSWLAEPTPLSFTAGSLSVNHGGANALAEHYAALAESILAPYTAPGDFAFRGVES